MAAGTVRYEILRNINTGLFTWRLNDEGEIIFASATFATAALAIADATAERALVVAAIAPPGPSLVSVIQAAAIAEAAYGPIVDLSAGNPAPDSPL